MPGMLQQAQQGAAQSEVPPEVQRAMDQQQNAAASPQPQQPQAQNPNAQAEDDLAPKTVSGGTAADGPDISGNLEQATAAEQKDYERAMRALTKVLYLDDNTSLSIVETITPEDKIGSIVKASVLLVSQLDDKIDMMETIIPQVTLEVVSRISEMGEAKYGESMALTDKEAQAALGATWEGVMEIYGVDAQDVQAAEAGIDEQTKAALKQQWESALNG